jgi:DNA gyrase subunit A
MDNEDKKNLKPEEGNPEGESKDAENQEKAPEVEDTRASIDERYNDKIDTTATAGIVPGLVDREVTTEVRTAFLSYSMSVIVSRAIPDVRDGLKPVQRRIIYGMNESGMQPGKPYKKSARIVGDVMGKYHPHGDAALYLTLVRLAQPFSMRYTLVDGHGNFGSIDGDEPAAMRYTEARMNRLAVEMVRDINEDTVDFVGNYDGTEKEPSVLPSRFPNLIVNGSQGIAVGMATNMAPHNLGEAIDAVVAIAKNPDLTPLEIMTNYLHGPDFPTGGTILGRKGILDAYTTGTGTVTIRSKYHIEEMENGKSRIIVTEIPYQVNKSAMIENIAQLVRDKVIDGITDIRDESNKEGIRVVIEVRRDCVPEVVANNLLKHTQLQVNFGIINLCLVDGAPKVLPITDLLKDYVEFQVEVLTRRTKFRRKRDADRDHIVQGLLIAQDNIDEVIHIIRDSKDDEESTARLEKRFNFDDAQVAAILAMTLRRLQGLERGKLEEEHALLVKNIAEYDRLLSSRDNIVDLMIQELTEIKDKFADKRLTDISDEAASIDNEDLLPKEDIIVLLTKNGYVKRMNDDTFRTQNRGGRGVKGISTTSGDTVQLMCHTKTHTDVLFFSSYGQVYRLRGYQIPDFAREGRGIPAINLLNLDQEEKVVAIVPSDDYPEDNYLFFATVNGIVKKTSMKEFASIHNNGKRAITLKEGDALLNVKRTDGHAIISLASSNGKVCSFYETDVRPMGRTAAGVKGMNLSDGSHLVDVTTSLEGDMILALTSKGLGKMSYAKDTDITLEDGSVRHYDAYRLTSRGAKGVISIKETPKGGKLVAMRAVHGDEDLMVVTNKGIVIRMPLAQVKIASRNTQGVKIINLEEHQTVASIAIVPHEDETEEDAEQAAPEEDEINPALVAPEDREEEAEAPKPAEKVVTPDELDDEISSASHDDGSGEGGSDDDI